MPSQVSVKVLSYNVFLRDQAPGLAAQNNERARLIANLIAQTDYDVVVFQEAFDNDARKEMIKILQNQGRFKYRSWVVGNDDELNLTGEFLGIAHLLAFRFPILYGAIFGLGLLGLSTGHPKSDGGVFILSRWPIVYQGQVLYRNAVGFDRFAKKGVIWALIDKQGLYFNVFGTHTQADEEKRSHDVTRQSQFLDLRTMMNGVGLYWLPAVIARDLNVDYCFSGDQCSPVERDNMLNMFQLFPDDAAPKGKLIFRNEVTKKQEEWFYSFNKNRDFERYFIPGQKIFERRPPAYNEMVLRIPQTTQVFAFEKQLTVEVPERPDRP